MNLLNGHKTANYVTTGFWGDQCFDEAKKYCTPNEVDGGFARASAWRNLPDPSNWKIDPTSPYLVYVDNETANGFEYNNFPFEVIPEGMALVADMSSNIATKPIDWSKYGVVYAGAQKNLGPSGMTLVVVRDDLIGKHRKDTPYMLEWKLFADSPVQFFNTPATWPIYVAGLNFKYMLKEGGLSIQTEKAKVRSHMLYSYIDSTEGYYLNLVDKKYRSRINVVFTIGPDHTGYTALENKFFKESTSQGLQQLKGLPAYGGLRVNMYNAMPIEGIVKLTAFMEKFR